MYLAHFALTEQHVPQIRLRTAEVTLGSRYFATEIAMNHRHGPAGKISQIVC
jgi:hypothetical protein